MPLAAASCLGDIAIPPSQSLAGCAVEKTAWLRLRPPSPPGLAAADFSAPLSFVRAKRIQCATPALSGGQGPIGSLRAATDLIHPELMQVSLHPQYERVLNGIISVRASLPSLISARLAFWVQTAERLQANRSAWLDSLPESARILHSHTGLHGPLLNYMHKFLVSRGYPNLSVAAQACEGFPSTGILARSHIWPEAPDKVERIAKVSPVSSVCADLRSRLNRWEACRSKDPHTEALLKKHLEAVRCGREREVSLHDVLSRPAALIHPCFGVKQGAKLREIEPTPGVGPPREAHA